MLSFTGRTGRLGWILYLIVTVGIALAAIAIYGDLTQFYVDVLGHRPSADERDQANLALIGLMAVSALVLLAATIRRLRDAGSKSPLLALIFGLAIPGFGWFFLAIRLLFGKEDLTPQRDAQAVRSSVPVTGRQATRDRAARKSDREMLISQIADMAANPAQVTSARKRNADPGTRSESFIHQAERAAQKRLDDAAHVHLINIAPDGPTVRRYRRTISAIGARKIAF